MISFRKFSRLILILLILVPALAACGNDDKKKTPKTTITISGAFALYPMVQVWADEYHKLHSDVQFDISAGGAGKGMTDVLAGAVDVAMVSREVRQEETDQGADGFAVVKDAVVATISANNPALDAVLAKGLTSESGAKIWLTTETTTWGALIGTDDASEIHVYTRADAAGAAEVWSKFMGGTAQEDLKGIAVQGDAGLAEAVRKDNLGIGFNNIGFAYDLKTGQPVEGLSIIPLDLNGDGQITEDENFYADVKQLTAAITDGRFPSPPARPLYLVTKGQPSAAVADFLKWILGDGQTLIDSAGYVHLTDDVIQASIEKLGAQ
jgi:phosphate transport system substrate-binding protein